MLVRPVLEYGNVMRTSRYVGDTNDVENVQRRSNFPTFYLFTFQK